MRCTVQRLLISTETTRPVAVHPVHRCSRGLPDSHTFSLALECTRVPGQLPKCQRKTQLSKCQRNILDCNCLFTALLYNYFQIRTVL